jgi:hypothetical protein
MRISTSEVLDCLSQLEWINAANEPQFRATLRANFAKSTREMNHFDRMYSLFFREMHTDSSDANEASLLNDRITQMTNLLRQDFGNGSIREAIFDFLAASPLVLLREIRDIRMETLESPQIDKFNLAPLASRLKVLMAIMNTSSALAVLMDKNPLGLDESSRRAMVGYFEKRLSNARSILMFEPMTGTDNIIRNQSYEHTLKKFGERFFSTFTEQELEEMRDAIDKLVRKLKNMASRRFAVKNRGSLDVKKTIRAAGRYSGVPVEIRYRNKARRKGQIVTLCDVSSSVWSAARFMLNLLYSLQDCFDKVNSFVFVDRLTEVTKIFEENEINEAIDIVLKQTDVNYNAPTDYGETFRHFKRNYMDILLKKTTLIIIGDARTNYLNPEDKILSEMRDRCRRLIWLNPESEIIWGTADSEIFTYAPYCHEVRPCSTLNQLTSFIEELVL